MLPENPAPRKDYRGTDDLQVRPERRMHPPAVGE